MIELNLQVEELISKNATDFQISKVFKNYYKNYLESIDTRVETTGGKDFFIKHTKHTDKFLILLYKYILQRIPLGNFTELLKIVVPALNVPELASMT